MPGVYVHLPFCPYICPYCDFAKWPLRRSQAQQYLAALEAEIAKAPQFAAQTLFFGGGTPNTYPPEVLARLVRLARERFALPAGAEVTVEVNPDRELTEGFEAYAAAGVTRLSIGAQSFDPDELTTLGRAHSPDDVREAVARARTAGIGAVSIDLMFGTPGTSEDRFARSLAAALECGADHISAYGLTVESGTPYEAWRAREPGAFLDGDAEARLYDRAIDIICAAGFEHYEISNFAKPGRRCAHNANYWRNGEYLGLGVGAASYRAGVRSVHTRDLASYTAAALAGGPIPGESEELLGKARAGEAVMLALRTTEGVDLCGFKERYHVDFMVEYAPIVADFRDAGLLEVSDERVALTRRGRFLASDVCSAFIL